MMSTSMKLFLYIYYIFMSLNTSVHCARCPACIKPENDQRVCGTDGRTYASICYLGRRICKGDSPDLAVAYSGKCVERINTVESKLTSKAPVTQHPIAITMNQPEDLDPVDRGIELCSVTLEPVCGTDGITYPSACILQRFATLPGKDDLSVARMGFCDQCIKQANPSKTTNEEQETQPAISTNKLDYTTSTATTTNFKITTEAMSTIEQKISTTTEAMTTTRPRRKEKPPRKPKPQRRRRKKQQSRKTTTTTIQPTPEIKYPFPNFSGSDIWTDNKQNQEPTVEIKLSFATTEQTANSESSFAIGRDLNFGFVGGSDQWTNEKTDNTESLDLVAEPEPDFEEPTVEPEPDTGSFVNPNFNFGGGSDWFVQKPNFEPEPEAAPATTDEPLPTTITPTDAYYGKLIGLFESRTGQLRHNIKGIVYAIDESTIRIVNFTYDGTAPDAYFWTGSTIEPDETGILIPDEHGRKRKLRAYDNQEVILKLPNNVDKTITDYRWIAVWCKHYQESFASVYIPTDFVPPSEHDLGVLGFKPRVHNVRSPSVVIIDTKTIRFHNITYDGNAPDTSFWIGSGIPDRMGRNVPYIGLNGRSIDSPLPPFRRDTVTVQLPSDVTVFDIDYIAVWAEMFLQNFGHVVIPDRRALNIPPFIEVKEKLAPTKSTIKPFSSELTTIVEFEVTKEVRVRNSESLSKNYQVSWTISGNEIEVELSAKLQDNQYMAFGISGSRIRSTMFGSDVAVAWMDGETPRVDDYYLGGYSQCSRGSGACRDESFILAGVNDYKDVTGSRHDGVTTISYRRKLNTGDALDMAISLTEAMYIVWAIGPINEDGLINKHVDIGGGLFNFGRDPVSNAQPIFMSDQTSTDNTSKWREMVILGRDVTTFDAKIGPTGGHQRYAEMTGNSDWGFAWYVNGKLAPKLILKRGVEYTFRVFGGDDESLIAQYHPFYITDDVTGGNPSSNIFKYQTIYAGPRVGGYCEYIKKKNNRNGISETFEDYFKTLKEKCKRRVLPGILKWTPNASTPDTVYYQCYTHQYFGWKIEVVDNFE